MSIKSSHLIKFFAGFGIVTTGLVSFLNLFGPNPATRASMLMALGLVFFWIVLGGTLMYKNRDRIREFVLKINIGWKTKFVIFTVALGLIEEAVTTTMTNLAPLFGVEKGEAFITVSTNYFHVILFHTGPLFLMAALAWVWLLKKYDFKPNHVFLLFGISGTMAEVSLNGLPQLASIGFWMFVYGLMIYLPAYSIPKDRNAKPIRLKHYFLAYIVVGISSIPASIIMGIPHILGWVGSGDLRPFQ